MDPPHATSGLLHNLSLLQCAGGSAELIPADCDYRLLGSRSALTRQQSSRNGLASCHEPNDLRQKFRNVPRASFVEPSPTTQIMEQVSADEYG